MLYRKVVFNSGSIKYRVRKYVVTENTWAALCVAYV